MILVLFIQSLPGIPAGIKDQGLIAVLFLIILGWAAAIYAIRQMPKALSPLIASIDRLVASNVEIGKRLTQLEDKLEAVEKESLRVSNHFHVRLIPSIAGLTIAYLHRAGMGEYAEQIHKDNPDAILPPNREREEDKRKN